jgi:hypothetical protein
MDEDLALALKDVDTKLAWKDVEIVNADASAACPPKGSSL